MLRTLALLGHSPSVSQEAAVMAIFSLTPEAGAQTGVLQTRWDTKIKRNVQNNAGDTESAVYPRDHRVAAAQRHGRV